MTKVSLWFLAMMQAWVPNGFDSDEYARKGARETAIETLERFESIATDMATVVMDPDEEPVFSGSQARIKTGALLLGIAYYEGGGFSRAVDFGNERGDNGRSWCLMQINLGKRQVQNPNKPGTYWEDSARRTDEGWTGRELVTDRVKCFRAALHFVKRTWGCGHFTDHLTTYASGQCYTSKHYKAAEASGDAKEMRRIRIIRNVSKERVVKGTGYFAANLPLFDDSMAVGGTHDVQGDDEVLPRWRQSVRQGEGYQGFSFSGVGFRGYSAP